MLSRRRALRRTLWRRILRFILSGPECPAARQGNHREFESETILVCLGLIEIRTIAYYGISVILGVGAVLHLRKCE